LYAYIHARTKRIEDAGNTDINLVLTLIAVGKGFSNPFSFVIASADADGIDIAPTVFIVRIVRTQKRFYCVLIFRLRVYGWIAVDLC
jgi:hypothetical protein